MTNYPLFANATKALRTAPAGFVVGWDTAEAHWRLYKATDGAPEGVRPEILKLRGAIVPLSEEGAMVLGSIIRDAGVL